MKLLRRMIGKEAGQVLPMALVLLLLGGIIIIPTLNFATTNLRATRAVDQHTRELYAADAGVEDALWYLQSEERVALLNPDVNGHVEYDLKTLEGDDVNNKDVQVAVDHAWLLGGLPNHNLPPSEPVAPINANNLWTVIGALNIDVQPRKNYIVDISTSETGTVYVDHIGVWLPQGYSYVAGSVKINGVPIGGPGTNYSLVKNPDAPVTFRSGNVLIWNYSSTTFETLSDIAPPPPVGSQPPAEKFPQSIRLSFDYTVTPFKEARGFYPWINLATGNRIAWDADAGFYHIVSTSITSATEQTTVEAYVPKGVVRYVSGSSGASSAIQGDYIAIGNSLMTCCWAQDKKNPGPPCNSTACTSCCGDNPYRNYPPAPEIFTVAAGYPIKDVERESSATVNLSGADAVPSDAKIERAYLYWTAWLRGDKVWLESPALPGHGTGSWIWTNLMGDDANWEKNAPQYVRDWLKANAYDGNALLAVNGTRVTPVNVSDPAGTVVADTWYISEGSSNVQPSYQYSCSVDVTAQVTAAKPDRLLRDTKFTVAGVHAHPATPSTGDCTTNSPSIDWSRSSNAGWSMVIIYSSAQKKTHQIYLYQGCEHLYNQTHEFTITGFATPLAADLGPGETNEAKMTVFASEGDVNNPPAEYLGFKGQNTSYYQLYDVSNTADVFNSRSSAGGFTASTISTCQAAGQISGIDIDNYTITRPIGGTLLSTIVHPSDTSANIKVQSLGDGLEVIYVVFSVRSTAIPAGQEFNVGSMLYRIQ